MDRSEDSLAREVLRGRIGRSVGEEGGHEACRPGFWGYMALFRWDFKGFRWNYFGLGCISKAILPVNAVIGVITKR